MLPPNDVLLSLGFGVLAYLVTAALARGLKVASVRRQYETANERLVERLQQLIRAQNDVLLLELEIAELAEKASPSDRAWWAVRMRKMAASMPPLFLEQARRFGLAEPPAEGQGGSEGLTVRPTVRRVYESEGHVERYEVAEEEARVERLDPWTGRAR